MKDRELNHQEFVFKVSVKENEVPVEKNSSHTSIFAQRQVIDQIKAKRSIYLTKDFILSNFQRRLSFFLFLLFIASD